MGIYVCSVHCIHCVPVALVTPTVTVKKTWLLLWSNCIQFPDVLLSLLSQVSPVSADERPNTVICKQYQGWSTTVHLQRCQIDLISRTSSLHSSFSSKCTSRNGYYCHFRGSMNSFIFSARSWLLSSFSSLKKHSLAISCLSLLLSLSLLISSSSNLAFWCS